MIIVIPYKYERYEGEELRYTLRSYEKHFTCLDQVILVTDKAPGWYKGDQLFCQDIPGRKEYSLYNKLIQVKGKVLYSNDDLLALKDFDESLPNYYWDTCGRYVARTRTYRELYRACLPDWKNFDVHTPMVIDTRVFEWFIDKPIKTYYANQNQLEGTELMDLKIKGDHDYSDIKDMIHDRPFFSTKDNPLQSGLIKVLQELYPHKSRYE